MNKLYRVQMNSQGAPDFSTAEEVEAVPVVHGRWMRYGEDGYPNETDTTIWQCDQCLETYYGRTTRIPNYCPNCGANMKMDGWEDGREV